MKEIKRIVLLPLLLLAVQIASAQDRVEWRNDRTGVYRETGLMTAWPAEGPELLWHFEGLGDGFSSVSIEGEELFATGYREGKGYLYVLNTEGKLLRKTEYGTEFDNSYPGARSTVIPAEGKLYVVSGVAELFCFDMQSLKLLWKKNYVKEYGAENTKHGWNGPPLIVDEKLIIAPGGKKFNVVALNKTTGNILWSSEGKGDIAGYGTPIFIGDQEVPQVVIMMGDYIIGLDVSNGALLWSHGHTNRFKEHPNTPVYSDGMLFCTSSYGTGSEMLRLTNGGKGIEKIWGVTELCHKTGHVMKAGNYIYGSGERMNWYCVDWQTGKIIYTDRTLAVGAVIAAEGLLYCYSEKGEMALVKPNPEKFEIISKFPITQGTAQHWAHPVIYKGVLYVRHGNSLMAYNIKQ